MNPHFDGFFAGAGSVIFNSPLFSSLSEYFTKLFFEINKLQQFNTVFAFYSNCCNFSPLTPPGTEKKKFHFFAQNDVKNRRWLIFRNTCDVISLEKLKTFFQAACELKLQSFQSECQITSGCCKSPLTITFHSFNNKITITSWAQKKFSKFTWYWYKTPI